MITTANYNEKAKEIDFSKLPEKFAKGHEFIQEATENGTNWSAYDEPEIKNMIDSYLLRLNEHLASEETDKKQKKAVTPPSSVPASKKTNVQRKQYISAPSNVKTVLVDEGDLFSFVERIPDEIKFIRRYVALDKKRKTKEDLLRFINALHRAIIEKKVRKTSPYAKQLNYIQDKLVERYNTMKGATRIDINPKTFNEFKSIIASEKVMPAVQLIKRYVSLNGRYDVKDKAKTLMDAMKRAFEKKKVSKKDKYISLLDKMYANLSAYVKSKSQKILNIEQPELNGLEGVLSGCGCEVNGDDDFDGLNGVDKNNVQSDASNQVPGVMNSMDFSNMKFSSLGFTGKWLNFIGDPSRGFSAMVFGKPKFGKSILCVDFAGYLARHHGNVLYIAKEEGLDKTLQEKLKDKDIAHPNLDVAEEIPNDLGRYDFIFFDSVNKLGLSVKDLETLRKNNPDKSFIYVFQTTKEGNFRGANEFQHDVDVVIEVPEKGLAIQNGRFNQGGEMRIFEAQENRQAA